MHFFFLINRRPPRSTRTDTPFPTRRSSDLDEAKQRHYLHGMTALTDIFADYELLEADDRYRLLIDLGRDFEPMPDALKTDATLVRGCSAAVWLYPIEREDGTLHFLADSNAAITKGIVDRKSTRLNSSH